jgi:hypothetical protein
MVVKDKKYDKLISENIKISLQLFQEPGRGKGGGLNHGGCRGNRFVHMQQHLKCSTPFKDKHGGGRFQKLEIGIKTKILIISANMTN